MSGLNFGEQVKGHQPKESIDLNEQLQIYFEYVVNLWLSFVPEPLKSKFPRDFSFPVTVPFFYLGELSPELVGVPQLSVFLEAYEKPVAAVETPQEAQPDASSNG